MLSKYISFRIIRRKTQVGSRPDFFFFVRLFFRVTVTETVTIQASAHMIRKRCSVKSVTGCSVLFHFI